ncbi:hypothetical protein Leryth_012316 [Lithospermum erythrorhizon]|nr:hypothetical protein Leryth_012316 [Lithospermum erythrorhizon]
MKSFFKFIHKLEPNQAMDLFPYEYLFIYTIIVGAIIIILYKLSPSRRLSYAPPEASGAWPIIGHLHLLRQPHNLPHHILGSLADKYGTIFTLRFGFHKVLVISGSQIAKEIFTSHDTVSLSRPKFRAAKHLGYNYAMFGFSPYGPYWKEIRKITSLELLSNRRHELLKHVQLHETNTSLSELLNIWEGNKTEYVLVDMKKWFNDLTYNVIVKMVVGKRYFGSHVGIDDQKDARECQKVMREFSRYLGLFLVSDFVPFLGWFDRGYEKAMKNTAMDLDAICEKWLQEHTERRTNNNKEGKKDEQDFMDVMMNVVDGQNLGGFDADTIVKSTCLAIIVGGSDTTAVMLIWSLSLLLNNRDALRKVQQELDLHIGKNRHVEQSDINKLVYLQAVVKETLRLYPAAPLGGRREFSEDCIIGDYHIPKGTWMVTNMWKLQRDPLVWPDPLEFKPERFLTATHKDIDVKGQQYDELIPFGGGRRICPGVSFGLEMMHLVLANLVRAFEISTENDVAVDMTESAGMTNMKATPLDVLVKPRHLST